MRNEVFDVIVLLVLFLASDALAQPGSPGVEDILDDLDTLAATASDWKTAEGAQELRIVMDRLRSAPDDLVVPHLVQVMNNHPGYASGQARRSAYGLLRSHKGALSEAGFAQLLQGLTDPDGFHASVVALRLTPDPKREELVQVVAPLLDEILQTDAPETTLSALVQLLTHAREAASGSLPTLIDLFEDPEIGLELRTSAAEAIVMIGGLQVAMGLFDIGNAVEVPEEKILAVLGGLWRSVPHTVAPDEHAEAFFSDAPAWVREEVQRIAIEVLEHPELTVRQLALRFLQPAFGDQLATFDGSDWIINPDVHDAVQKVANEDPDPDIRQHAEWLLMHGLSLHVARIKQSVEDPDE